MAKVMPLKNPSLTFHALCAYWLTSRPGSSAKAHNEHFRRMLAAMIVIRRHAVPTWHTETLKAPSLTKQRWRGETGFAR